MRKSVPKLTHLKKLRIERGLFLWQVASVVGCSESLISRWENGWQPLPEWALEKLAELYGVSTKDLMEDSNEARMAKNSCL